MITVPKEPYWEKLVTHFFDNIWGKEFVDIIVWLDSEFNIDTEDIRYGNSMTFRDEQSATAFLLRWS